MVDFLYLTQLVFYSNLVQGFTSNITTLNFYVRELSQTNFILNWCLWLHLLYAGFHKRKVEIVYYVERAKISYFFRFIFSVRTLTTCSQFKMLFEICRNIPLTLLHSSVHTENIPVICQFFLTTPCTYTINYEKCNKFIQQSLSLSYNNNNSFIGFSTPPPVIT